MSWSIEEHIGDCRPFPVQVVVYKGETDECLAYVSGEVADRLKAENAKLRELAAEMYPYAKAFLKEGAMLGCVDSKSYDWFLQLRELGIEVCV